MEQHHRKRRAVEGDGPSLDRWMMIVLALWAPAIVVHEVTHYVVARLLGIGVAGVVFFQFSAPYAGVNWYDPDRLGTPLEHAIVRNAPVFVCAPLGCLAVQLTAGAPTPGQFLFGMMIAFGFFYCAIPDHLRTWLLAVRDNNE